jgi:NTP pyrophosphatase (non-canonical NTP hydrolase)
MDQQEQVAAFLDEHDLGADPAYRLLDLAAEVGELAADATESTDYGATPAALAVSQDEVGDALFSLLALCEALEVDAGAALDDALAKYRERIDATGDPASDG